MRVKKRTEHECCAYVCAPCVRVKIITDDEAQDGELLNFFETDESYVVM